MSYVVDASVTLTWCLPGEETERTTALHHRLREGGVYVPHIWPLETANILVLAVRDGRLEEEEFADAVALLQAIDVTVDQPSLNHVLDATVPLARRQAITTYDASYVELAARLDLPLATNDREMARAARAIGIEIL